MSGPASRVSHPHVVRDAEVCGGSPVIVGTRFPVRSVVYYILRRGETPEELVERFPHLSLAQVYDALSYFYDNRMEIDADTAANTEAGVRAHLAQP